MQDAKPFQFKENPYQYTRGIRFFIKSVVENEEFSKEIQRIQSADNKEFYQSDLPEILLNFHNDLSELLFYKSNQNHNRSFKKDQEGRLSHHLSVKKAWLMDFYKGLFYSEIGKKQDGKYKANKYKLSDLKSVGYKLKEQIKDWEKYSLGLKHALEQPQESKARHSDIAEYIRILSGREQLICMERLLEEILSSDPDLDKKIDSLTTQLDSLKQKLESAQKFYLSSQPSGMEVTRTSFNYYTVNKKPKENYDQKLHKTKKQLKNETFSTIKKINNEKYSWKDGNHSEIFQFVSGQEKGWLKEYCESHQLNGWEEGSVFLSLDGTYKAMKIFKAKQKSRLYEWFDRNARQQKTYSKNLKKTRNSSLLSGYIISEKEHKVNNEEREVYNSFEEVNKQFSLFKFIDKKDGSREKKSAQEHYNKFLELSRKIQTETDSQKKTSYKKARGNFLFGNYCYFEEYKEFCQKYREIAQKRGRFIAQIKGLEKERREAIQTAYWALIYCDGDNKQLWFVPKEKMSDARKSIYDKNNEKSYSLGDSQCLCCFESLTMRALHKLCFSEQSSFVEEMPQDLKSLQKASKEIKTGGDDEKLREKNIKKLKFFKKLLYSDYAKEKLHLENFNLTKVTESERLEEFEKELEIACYYVKRINFPDKRKKDDFIKNHDISVLDISSYDLEGRNKNTHQTPISENKYHTDLWKTFWDNIDNSNKSNVKIKGFCLGEVRLNPEIRIYYRRADDNLEKYFRKRDFPAEFNHRRKKDQLTVHFTLSLNAGEKYEELAFVRPEELLQKIDDFNQKLNSEMDFKTTWKYGIDRGNKELATLCLVKFDPKKDFYQVDGKNCLQPTFPSKGGAGVECWTLMDSNYSEEYTIKTGETKKRWAIQNLSYFLDKKELFKKESISCLDLTTAKLIKGRIVTNGDVMTYLKLKKVASKRQIFELYSKGKINKDTKFHWSSNIDEDANKKAPESGVLNIKISDGTEKTIYRYTPKYENIPVYKGQKYNRENITNSLRHYLNRLIQNDDSHTPTILQINHLRDAITANMVGVICHLLKYYKGFIIMEDLPKANIDRHFFNSNENISRRLEKALYNKLQSMGLVPPHVKDIIRLREEKRQKSQKLNNRIKSSQIGAIVFLDEKDTSKLCPYCEVKDKKNTQKDEKYRQKRFICGNCGFDTYHFTPEKERVRDSNPPVKNIGTGKFEFLKDINDPDKVAAYNIAKKIVDPEKIEKMNQV